MLFPVCKKYHIIGLYILYIRETERRNTECHLILLYGAYCPQQSYVKLSPS